MNIKDYGFKENLLRINMEGKIPARIVATHKERYEIVSDKGNGFAKIKRGCFYDNPNSIYPTTGDFVLIEWNENGDSMITETLRRERFKRQTHYNIKKFNNVTKWINDYRYTRNERIRYVGSVRRIR